MTQEEKELVLRDLCARLPYRVKVRIEGDWFYDEREPYDTVLKSEVLGHLIADVYSVKPYLRPMSSLTEEENEWLNDRINFSRDDEVDKVRQKWGIVMQEIYTNSSKYVFSNFTEILDWLNEHHFDYRGLIEKGLALAAPIDY